MDVYIHYCEYQVKPRLSPWISNACTAAKADRIYLIHFYHQSSSCATKVTFRHASNCCKRVLDVPEIKRGYHFSQTCLPDFGKLLLVFSTKVNLLCFFYLVALRCCVLNLVKQNYLLKFFLRTLILITQVYLCLFSLFRTILKIYTIPVAPRLVKKVSIIDLDSSNMSCPNCIPVVVLKNCVSELLYRLAELFNRCLKDLYSTLFEGLMCGPCVQKCLGENFWQKATPLLVSAATKFLKNL